MAVRVASLYADVEVRGTEAERQLADLRKELDKTQNAAKSGSTRFTELSNAFSAVQQVAGAVGGVFQKTYQMIGEGAKLQLAEAQFDNLTKSIGVTSDALMTDLRGATQGMMSDAQLMAGASDIISLGLADNQEDTVRLAKAVGVLGLDMQQVILTFANNSKARLDSLGLSMADVTARTKAYTDAGMEANKAFDTAVLDALDAKMSLLGNTADTTAGKMAMLAAAQENLTNSFKEYLAVQWAGPIGGLADTLDASKQATDNGVDGWLQAAIVLNEFVREIDPATAALQENWLQQQKTAQESTKLADYTDTLANSYAQGSQHIDRHGTQTNILANSYAAMNSQTRELTLSIKQQALAYGNTMAMANQYADANRTTSAQIFEATAAENQRRMAMEASAAAEAELTSGTLAFFNSLDSTTLKEYQSILGETTTTSVLVAGRTEEQEEALGKLQSQYEKAAETVRDYEYGVKGANLTDEERAEKIVEQQELMGQLQGSMAPLVAIQSEYATVTSGGAINQELLNQKIFDAIQANTDNAAAVAIAGEALGIYTAEEAEARLQSALLDEQIRRQIASWDGTAAGIENVKANIQNYISELNNIPSEINTTVRTTHETVGTPSGPGGGAGSGVGSGGGAQAFAIGGWTGLGGGRVDPLELVVPNNIIQQGPGAINEFANQHVPGGVSGGGGSMGGNTYYIDARGATDPAAVGRQVEAGLRRAGKNSQTYTRMK